MYVLYRHTHPRFHILLSVFSLIDSLNCVDQTRLHNLWHRRVPRLLTYLPLLFVNGGLSNGWWKVNVVSVCVMIPVVQPRWWWWWCVCVVWGSKLIRCYRHRRRTKCDNCVQYLLFSRDEQASLHISLICMCRSRVFGSRHKRIVPHFLKIPPLIEQMEHLQTKTFHLIDNIHPNIKTYRRHCQTPHGTLL